MTYRSLIVGTLLLGISAAAGAEDVIWINAVATSVSGNTLTKTGGNSAWDAGASSLNVLQDGYGYVEFTATETTTYRLCGLSNGDSDQNYTDVDYGILLRSDTSLAVYEAGGYRGDFGSYAAGDRLRVEIAHGTVKYRRNGVLFYTSTVPPRFPLRVDSALYSPAATLTNVRIGALVWINDSGVAIAENTLTKTNSAGWTAGAASANEIVSGDAFVEFTATETNTSRLAGLSNGDSGTSSSDVDFGIHLLADGTLEVLEDGVSSGGLGSYGGGDRLRVELRGGVVRYYKNASLLYTSSGTPTYPLRVDTALETPSATLTDVVVSGVAWTDQVGVAVTGNTLRKTASDGWNASAASTNQIASGDGFAEFMAVETNKRRTFGLNSGSSAQTYSDMDFAIDLSAGGVVEIFENGVSKGQFGSYTSGDRFRVEVSGGTVVYRKNETVFYTSSNAPSYPLHADAALYTSGATVANVVVGELVWTNVVGLQPLGTGLMRTSSGTGWAAGAASTKTIETGYFAFTAGVAATNVVAGLAQGDTDQNFTDVDFGILLRSDGSVAVYEAGNYRGEFGNYVSGDRFRVAVASNVVSYARNGSVFYTSGVTPTLPLRADTSFYQVPSLVLNGVLSESLDQVDTPSFSPAGGSYSTAQTVTISCATSGALIRYTVDGSEPSTSSSIYSSAVTVNVSQTLKAKAWATGLAPSNVGTAVYTLTVPNPSLAPVGGTYVLPLTVTISSSVSGSELHYTLNGSDPTLSDSTIASGGTIAIDSSSTVKAKAWKTGWTESGVAAASYTVKVATPTLSPGGGSYSSAQSVTVTVATSGATIHYTTNGANPTEADPTVASGSAVQVAKSGVLKAAAWRSGASQSDTGAGTYWLSLGTVTTPVLSPLPGTYTAIQTVTATAPTGATIRYTTDGTEPAFGSALYTGPLSIANTTLLKVKAFRADMTASASAGGLYRIDLGSVDAPRFTGSAPGTYPTFRSVTITSETSGATVHYTTDGRDPDETSPVVTSGSSVTVSQPLLLRARAFKSGMTPSPIIQGLYHITGAVAAGRNHVMALKADGSVWSWGSNNWGMLGDPSFAGSRRATPGQVPGLTDVVAISGGGQHSLALKRDGTIWSWGQNTWGQLGDGTSTDRNAPVQVSQTTGLTNAVAIAAGVTHSVALANDGSVWIWGLDGLTQFGGLPVHVNNLSGVAQIAAGAFSATLKTDGEAAGQVWTFGYNGFGNLGDGTKTDRTAAVPVVGLSNGVAIAAGDSHGLAVTSGGAVSTWGNNGFGQLGDGTTTEHLTPIVVPGLSQIVLVSAGSAHSFFLQSDGKAFAAGYNYQGGLGVGEVGEHYNPTAVVSPEKLTAIASLGANAAVHSSAVAPSGHVLVWGNGTDGELGNGVFDTASGVPLVVPDFSVTTDALLTSDIDGDGLSNEEEVALGTDPGNRDTNGDGVPDGAAVQAGISPTNADMDGDGVSNAAEAAAGTDPFMVDTDGDGHNDGQDCFPLDPSRWQCPTPDPNDHTPPVITLQEPTNATLISSVPPQ